MASCGDFFNAFAFNVKMRMYLQEKREIYTISYDHDAYQFTPIKYYEGDLMEAATDFLYDPLFERAVAFLLDSPSIVKDIKEAPHSQTAWQPFYLWAKNIQESPDLHPYYFILLADIVNFYRQMQNNPQCSCFEIDHFKKLGESYAALKTRIDTLIQAYTNCADGAVPGQAFYTDEIASGILLPNIHIEFTPSIDATGEQSLHPSYVLHPKLPGEMIDYLLPECYAAGLIFKRCEHCMRYFVTTGVGNPKFCNRLIDGTGKSCRQLMPKANYNKKIASDPVNKLYNRAYKTMYSRVTVGTMKKESFQAWAKDARQERDRCIAGQCTLEEYSTWLCDSGVLIDYLKEGKV